MNGLTRIEVGGVLWGYMIAVQAHSEGSWYIMSYAAIHVSHSTCIYTK